MRDTNGKVENERKYERLIEGNHVKWERKIYTYLFYLSERERTRNRGSQTKKKRQIDDR